ncbi:MAG: NADH-quinone oxidoreductase subunit [Frankiales bacterium]|jgi:NADH-quinone oxidoreductase subunit M|nr:NADH-quinone oxidoreductase subunit [Frankiales bacterium]
MSWQQVILVGLLVVPAMGALAAVLLPRAQESRSVPIGIAASGVTLAGTLVLLFGWLNNGRDGSSGWWESFNHKTGAVTVTCFGLAKPGLQFVSNEDYLRLCSPHRYGVNVSWLHSIGVRFHLTVDGISLPLLALTALLTFLCLVYSARHLPEAGRPRALVALVLLLEVGMLGTFLAADLIVFFVFFEVVLVPMYFLIGIWGGTERKQYAATKFILYTLLGSAFMLLGFLGIGLAHHSFDFSLLPAGGLSHRAQDLCFLALLVGFGIKAPMWPLHTWLPDAHTEAPTIGSVLLAGVLLKMGTYGLIRIALPALPLAAHDFAPYLGVLATIGIVYGSLVCLAQRSLKRMIAFSSVGHMGFVLLGISTLTQVGINGALIGNVAHGLITGLLFFLVGSLKDRYHTDVIDEIGGGAQAKVPYLGGLLGFTAIASLGLPGLAGFWGEMLALLGAYHPAAGLPRGLFLGLMTAGGIGAVLTAGYLLWMLARVNQGVVPPQWRPVRIPDADLVELAVWTPLVVLTIAIGVYPRLVLGLSNAAVSALTGGLR